jgi:hypothetical protein
VPGREVHPPSRDEVMRWSEAERLELARILDELIPRALIKGPLRRRRMLVLVITGGGAILLGPWIAYLTSVLPPTESGGAWRTAWVGLDSALAVTLAATAWLVWHRRSLAMVGLAVSATLLLVDAWFDVCLSWGTSEQWGAIFSACVINLPVSAYLITSIVTMLQRTFAVVQQLRGAPPEPVSVWRQPVVMEPARPR